MHLRRRTPFARLAGAAAVAAVLAVPAPLAAQYAAPPHAPVRVAPLPTAPTTFAYDSGAQTTLVIDTVRAPAGRVIAAAAVSAAVSSAMGAVIGYNIIPDRTPYTDDPGLDGMITGWIFAPALVTPAVVHIVNNGRGNIAVMYGAAGAIAIAGYVLGYGGSDAGVALALGAPLFQTVSAVVLERRRQ